VISIKNLSFSYGEKIIFSDFSLEIDEKNMPITVLNGPSGCGKTTLTRIIASLETNYSGEIHSDFRKIGYMFQEDRLLPWFSALDNVMAVMENKDEIKAKKALEMVELSELSGSLPDNMSGGQQRRVSLARAIAYEPDLLILDEPFKGLDYELQKRIAERLKALNIPIIATLHSQDEIDLMGGRLIFL